MAAKLSHCLRSEVLHSCVFGFKELEVEGQCNSLLPFGQDQVIILVFEPTHPPGNPAGHVEMMLKGKSKYLSP